jgi:cytochrome c-type biogenesis protein CcmH/NrfG
VSQQPGRGLPARIYLPIVAILGIAFLGAMMYLIAVGFDVTGSVFGKSAPASGVGQARQPASATNVQGGPPPAVMEQLATLRARVAKHPNDDVALTQLADMYLAANKFDAAIPLYERALKANPHNVAAQTGLAQAQDSLRQ